MKAITGTVTLNYKDENGKDASISSPVTYQVPENDADVISLMQTPDDLKSLLENIAYATNLNARAVVRRKLESQVEGPGKAIEKAIKDLVKAREAMGKPITEEAARVLILG